jgi:hypothetical protein
VTTSAVVRFWVITQKAALIAWLPVVRVDELVKDRRPPKAAALRAVLDKLINTNKGAVQAIKAALSIRRGSSEAP